MKNKTDDGDLKETLAQIQLGEQYGFARLLENLLGLLRAVLVMLRVLAASLVVLRYAVLGPQPGIEVLLGCYDLRLTTQWGPCVRIPRQRRPAPKS